MNTAIAQHLNVAESAIVRVEMWANVVFAVVKGLGARFVSKKVLEGRALSVGQLEAIGGNRWQKYGKDRVYFELAEYVSLSSSKARKLSAVKLYWENGDFYHTASSCQSEVAEAVREITRRASEVPANSAPVCDCCYNCGSAYDLMGGSLGSLCANCYDEIEAVL